MLEVVIIAIVALFASLILKKEKQEYATLVIILACLFISTKVLRVVDELIVQFQEWESFISQNKVYAKLLLKMIGITYICEFAANLCKDAGHQTLSNNIEIFGKVMIMVAGLPIVSTMIEMLEKMLAF